MTELTVFSSLGKGLLASLTLERTTGLTGPASLMKRQTGLSNLEKGLNGLSSRIKGWLVSLVWKTTTGMTGRSGLGNGRQG